MLLISVILYDFQCQYIATWHYGTLSKSNKRDFILKTNKFKNKINKKNDDN
jgi:hypothetical protein